MPDHPARWSALVAPILLVLTAAIQMLLVQYGGLSPWKGGGFGMFATLDHTPFRGVDIVVEAPDRSESIEIAPSLEFAGARAVTFPSAAPLKRLARAVVARERRQSRPVDTVKLTVWRQEFNSVTLHSAERYLRSYVYQAQ